MTPSSLDTPPTWTLTACTVALALVFAGLWTCVSIWTFVLEFWKRSNASRLKMDYLTDPAVITPILVVTFHFLTAAGFWFFRRRRTPRFQQGKL